MSPTPDTAVLDAPLTIAARSFRSRLLLGTARYASVDLMKACHEASGCEIVTLPVRRAEPDPARPSLLDSIDPKRHFVLATTAGSATADEAVAAARRGRELGLAPWVMLEVTGDERTLWPDTAALVEAARVLVEEGFVVLPHTSCDPVVSRRLQDAGCAAVLPIAAPVGSGLGILDPNALSILIEQAQVPVVVDAGVGTASDATIAMELGADGVLLNAAVAGARHPIRMAEAMRDAVKAGRAAFLSGRIEKKRYAAASPGPNGLFR